MYRLYLAQVSEFRELVFRASRVTSESIDLIWPGTGERLLTVLKHVPRLPSSPFTGSAWTTDSLVIAFDVDFDHIVGIDYLNPLCQDGRFVLESSTVTKRMFATVLDAKLYYDCPLDEDCQPSPNPCTPHFARAASESLPAAAPPAQNARPTDRATSSAVQDLPRKACNGHDSSGSSSTDSEWTKVDSTQCRPIRTAVNLNASGGVGCRPEGKQPGHSGSQSDNGNRAIAPHGPTQTAKTARAETSTPTASTPVNSCQEYKAGSSVPMVRSMSAIAGPTAFGPAAAGNQQQQQEQRLTKASAVAANKQLSLAVSHSVPDLHTPQAADWPSPSSWTVPACTFTACTLIIWFTDPRLPDLLRPVIQGDEHLLKLYESGLPAWAVHMPHYGIFYRPWMRTVTWLLFVAISIFSLSMGFYDLHKNVPYLDQVLRGLVGSLHLPAASIFRWLDTHVVVRLSILCAYLFGKSPFAAYLLYWAAVAASAVRATVGPMVSGLATVLSPLGAVLRLVRQILQPLFTVVRTGLQAPVLLASAAYSYIRALAVLVWQCLQAFGVLFRAGAKTASTGQALSSQAAWWYMVPVDALEVLRASGMKVVRALQVLMRCTVQVGSDIARHRLTLMLRLRRQLAGWKAWWRGLVHAWLAALLHSWAVSSAWVAKLWPGAYHETAEGAGGVARQASAVMHEKVQ